jgi:hypothetical protein
MLSFAFADCFQSEGQEALVIAEPRAEQIYVRPFDQLKEERMLAGQSVQRFKNARRE